MKPLVVLHGTGDCYLVAALAQAFEQHHGIEVRLVVKQSHTAVVDLFPGVRYDVDNDFVREAEVNRELQERHHNDPLNSGSFYVHPSFVRSGARLDQLTTLPGVVSQADMYRCLLRLPMSTPLALPVVTPQEQVYGSVVVIKEARSWPNSQPAFWDRLIDTLYAEHREVYVNDGSLSLEALFRRCAAAEWVIGPQCGVMAILCAARFPCRKTIATPSIDGNEMPGQPSRETYPYAYTTKFTGERFDAEEFKITDDNHAALVHEICGGVNALRLRPHDPRPVCTVDVALTPGDFLDRFAVLTVKMNKFAPEKRALVSAEYWRYSEIIRQRLGKLSAAFHELVAVHAETFDLLARAVPSDGELDHLAAMRLNRRRVELRQRLDAAYGSPDSEVKDYYDGLAVPKVL